MNENTEQRLANLSPAKRALLEARMTRREGKVQHSQSIPRRVEDAKSGLSFAQERIWLHQQIQPSSIAYNRPTNIRLKGPLDVTIFRLALAQLLERHESLRSTVACEEGNPYLVVKEAESLEMPLLDLRGEVVPEDRAQEIAAEEACRPFDLGRGPLLRAQLLRLGNEEHLLLLTIHHFTFDAWSEPVLLDELSSNYGALRRGDTTPRKALPIQCTDFAAWDRSVDRVAGLDSGRAYWRAALADPPVLQLKTDYPLPLEPSEEARDVEFELPDQLLARLREMAKREEATLFSLLLSAFVTLLHRYTGEEDIVVGCPVAGRTREELEPLIGVFINMLPLRAKVGARDSFRSLLGRVQESVLQGLEHQEVPLQFMVQDVLSDRDSGGSPLYQTMFIHERLPLEPREVDSVSFESEEAPSPGAIMDLTMEVSETESRVIGRLKYRRELWDEPTIACMVGHFLTLLEGFTIDPGKCLGELPMLTEGERHQLLVAWNDTAVEYPDKCVHQLFEEQVVRAPEAVAVVFEDKQLTYDELNERANRVAHALIAHGVGPDALVGICVERSFEMIVGLLGILKAGGVYVPLDPDYPEARLAFMLEDCGKPLLVTTEGLSKRFVDLADNLLFLDDDSALAGQPVENPGILIDAKHPAYVIYTSGSTGRPKGSMVSHGALVNHMCWMRESFPIEPSDKLLQKTPFTFDASVWEFFAPLLEGGQLVMALPDGHLNPGYLIETMIDQSITVLQVVPTLLRALMSHKGFPQTRSLKRVFSGGESLTTDLQATFFSQSHASLYNLYGPTEACIDTTAWPCRRDDLEREVAIGRPIANVQVYVIDRHGQVVPIGIPGELYIGGAGLARGYLNRPELTAERFVEIDILGRTERVYRTGDLCCWRSDGNLEFLGRLDDQVKLRGFRIELGEIEAVLIDHPDVAQCVVVLREDRPGDQRLVAYCVPKAHGVLNTNALREHVGERLPNYMVPSAFVLLDKFPLTSSGKISRRDLPEPDGSRQDLGADYVAPRNLIEENLVLIWNEVLGIERVGIHDNFFELGGHSLVAIRVNARISSELQVDFSVRNLFEAPTIAGLADKVEEARGRVDRTRPIALIPVERNQGDRLPLSFAQQRLWFLAQMEEGLTAYNMSLGWRVLGLLDLDRLERALESLVRRHEVLRTTFSQDEGDPFQVIGGVEHFDIPMSDLSKLTREERQREVVRAGSHEAKSPFNLECDLMLRARLLRLADDEHVLFLTVHHIASDGWSVGVLWRELSELYAAEVDGRKPVLPELLVQYADYAWWQRAQLDSQRTQTLLDYWMNHLRDIPSALELPTDYPRGERQTYCGGRQEILFDSKLTKQIKDLGHEVGATSFMTLLAAFQLLLSRLSGQDEIVVGAPVAGRMQSEVESLIGIFLNNLVLRGDLGGGLSFRELLGQVRSTVLDAHDHDDLPFEQLLQVLRPEQDLSQTPLFQVLFNGNDFEASELVLQGARAERFDPEESIESKYDLTVYLRGQGSELLLSLVYNIGLFCHERMEEVGRQFSGLISQVVANPDRDIGSYSLVTSGSCSVLPDSRQPLQSLYGPTVVEQVDAWAERAPDSVAIQGENSFWSYGELATAVQKNSCALNEAGVREGAVVALLGDRSFGLIVGLLSVLKSGAVAVPLDPSLPVARIEALLEEAEVRLVVIIGELTDEMAACRFGAPHIRVAANTGCVELGSNIEAVRSSSKILPLGAATIFFTSGTTGTPKGVFGSHQALSHFVNWQRGQFGVGPGDRVAQVTGVTFDVILREIFLPLTSGATLCLPEERLDEGEELWRWLEARKITILHSVPSRLESWLADIPKDLSLDSIRWLFMAGEPLTDLLVKKWRESSSGEVINLYGSTETGPAKLWYQVPSGEELRQGVQLLGNALPQTQALIMSEGNRLCGVGELGEIVVRTPFLALGYLGAEANEEAFFENPFGTCEGDVLYRTGDLGRYLPDGQVEIAGRRDDQVKIRGVRVEPAEVSAVLGAEAGVAQCFVGTFNEEGGEVQLAAWVVPEKGTEMTGGMLRQSLSRCLPLAFVPSHFVFLQQLPLTANGKVDRRALPSPELDRAAGVAYTGPSTPLEVELATVWREILGIDRVGIHDNFFGIGGHSLLAIRLISQIRKGLDVEMPLRILFENPTIELLSLAILEIELSHLETEKQER